jgi:hypothetical protein
LNSQADDASGAAKVTSYVLLPGSAGLPRPSDSWHSIMRRSEQKRNLPKAEPTFAAVLLIIQKHISYH